MSSTWSIPRPCRFGAGKKVKLNRVSCARWPDLFIILVSSMVRHVAREHHRSRWQPSIDYKNDPDYARKLQRCLICWKWHKCNADHQNCMKRHRQCLSDLNMDVDCPKCHQVGVNLNLILFLLSFQRIVTSLLEAERERHGALFNIELLSVSSHLNKLRGTMTSLHLVNTIERCDLWKSTWKACVFVYNISK